MPNLAATLKDEILRLARKEVRGEVEALRKTAAKQRADISALKHTLADLEKRQARLEAGKPPRAARAGQAGEEAVTPRYSAKGLTKLRARLGLSGAELGGLLGVSTQSIYNWEAEKARPRADTIRALAELRKVGKREIKARLAALVQNQVTTEP